MVLVAVLALAAASAWVLLASAALAGTWESEFSHLDIMVWVAVSVASALAWVLLVFSLEQSWPGPDRHTVLSSNNSTMVL